MHTSMILRSLLKKLLISKMNFFLLMYFLLLPNIASAQWSGSWQSKGSDVLIGLSTEPSNPDFAKNSYLVIGYTKNFSCSSVVSVLIINGQKLGSPTGQKKSRTQKNQLKLTVNGKLFTGETKLNEYTNGMELAMSGSDLLIKELSINNSTIDVRIGNTSIMNFSKASNFTSENSRALSNCR